MTLWACACYLEGWKWRKWSDQLPGEENRDVILLRHGSVKTIVSYPQPRARWGSWLGSYSLCSLFKKFSPRILSPSPNAVLPARSTIQQRNAVYKAQVTFFSIIVKLPLNSHLHVHTKFNSSHLRDEWEIVPIFSLRFSPPSPTKLLFNPLK